MRKSFIAALFGTVLLSGAAVAQTQPPAGSENAQDTQPPAVHNTMLPATHHTAMNRHRRHRPAATAASNSGSSSSGSTPSSPNANPEATPGGPDQSKPGTQTRPQGNTTTMHTPGSENPADTGAGAPKN